MYLMRVSFMVLSQIHKYLIEILGTLKKCQILKLNILNLYGQSFSVYLCRSVGWSVRLSVCLSVRLWQKIESLKMSKTMQNSVQTRKQKLHTSMSKPQKTFQTLTLMVIGSIIAQINPIQVKQPLDKCEEAKIQFRLENKSCIPQ